MESGRVKLDGDPVDNFLALLPEEQRAMIQPYQIKIWKEFINKKAIIDRPLPNRISIDKNDPGYIHDGVMMAVWLDDVRQQYVTTADVKEGMIIKYKLDAHGRPLIEGPELVSEVLHGVVRLEWLA